MTNKHSFRQKDITRNCEKKYADYRSYKPHLKKDFNDRCAYCNLKSDLITSFFEIDHFVPKKEYKIMKMYYLETDYKNLVYSCRKCNNAKSDQFSGDLSVNPYENKDFYDPVKIDYNSIFYRDDKGRIKSEDDLGKRMIESLKLNRPIHSLPWMIEQLEKAIEKIKKKREDNSIGNNKNQAINEVYIQLLEWKDRLKTLFIKNYNNNDFTYNDIVTAKDIDDLLD